MVCTGVLSHATKPTWKSISVTSRQSTCSIKIERDVYFMWRRAFCLFMLQMMCKLLETANKSCVKLNPIKCLLYDVRTVVVPGVMRHCCARQCISGHTPPFKSDVLLEENCFMEIILLRIRGKMIINQDYGLCVNPFIIIRRFFIQFNKGRNTCKTHKRQKRYM